MNHCSIPLSDTNDLRYGISNDVSQVLNHNVSISYSQSCVSPQGNFRGISHVQQHGSKVQESDLWTNLFGHDSIFNNLQCGGIPPGDSHSTDMQNMEYGTMSGFSTGMSLGQPKLLAKFQTVTIMITHIVHQAQNAQQRLKIIVLIKIDPNEVALLHHRR